MKNFILKFLGYSLVAISLLALIGLGSEISEGTSSLDEDWVVLLVILIIASLGVSLLRMNSVAVGNLLLSHSIKKNEKMVEKIGSLEDAIKVFDAQYDKEKSSNIYVGNNIIGECLVNHKKKHKALNGGEKPLLILNSKKSLLTKLFPFTGFVITDKNIYFATLKRSFVTGIFPFKEKPNSIPLEYVTSFQIGEHDTCFGTAYVGHNLMINGQVLGLARLGYGMLYDDKALEYINGLSQYLFDEGFLYEKPQKFSW